LNIELTSWITILALISLAYEKNISAG